MPLSKLETELKIRGFSEKTVSSYLFHNQKFLDFIQKPKEDVDEDDIKSYLAHLISDKKLKSASVNLAMCTLKFLYEKLLEKDIFKKIDLGEGSLLTRTSTSLVMLPKTHL